VLSWLVAGPIAPAGLATFENIQVMLASAPAAPAPRARPLPPVATAPATANAAATVEPAPQSTTSATDAGRDEPLVEARHDVTSFNNPKPPYPLAARRRGLQGRVLIAAHVRTDGSCTEVRVRQSSGHALLDDSARDTVQRWRFLPARRGTTPVDAWVEVPITFKLDS
jgi:periplasmic protein TonB